MNKLKTTAQKIKGKLDQAKGEVEKKSGYPLKGTVDKVKGEVEEKIADTKLKAEKDANDTETEGKL